MTTAVVKTIPTLTICQPWASLIALPDDHPDAKRVENRTWPTSYRGPLVIHAGMGRKWLDSWHGRIPESLPFGAVVAVATLYDCLRLPFGELPPELKWLRTHQHVEGPVCWILTNVRRLEKPLPWKGAQGLWRLPISALEGRLVP